MCLSHLGALLAPRGDFGLFGVHCCLCLFDCSVMPEVHTCVIYRSISYSILIYVGLF